MRLHGTFNSIKVCDQSLFCLETEKLQAGNNQTFLDIPMLQFCRTSHTHKIFANRKIFDLQN
jgi:hypothetical protein